MKIVDYLWNLAGVDRCAVCGVYTSESYGWHEDTTVCRDCFDILVEAAELAGDDQ